MSPLRRPAYMSHEERSPLRRSIYIYMPPLRRSSNISIYILHIYICFLAGDPAIYMSPLRRYKRIFTPPREKCYLKNIA